MEAEWRAAPASLLFAGRNNGTVERQRPALFLWGVTDPGMPICGGCDTGRGVALMIRYGGLDNGTFSTARAGGGIGREPSSYAT